jgi:hypothetical protein
MRAAVHLQRHNDVAVYCLGRVSDLLVYVQFSEDLCRIKEMLVLEDPAMVNFCCQVALPFEFARTSLRSMPTRAG